MLLSIYLAAAPRNGHSGVVVDVVEGSVDNGFGHTAVNFEYVTKQMLNGPAHTLENVFKCYFLEDMERIYNDTHVDRRVDEKTYNFQSKKMCMFRSVVSYLLLFCDEFPSHESSVNYRQYQKMISKLVYTAVKSATAFLEKNSPDSVGEGGKIGVAKFVDTMKKMNKLGKLKEKNHPKGTTAVLTKNFK